MRGVFSQWKITTLKHLFLTDPASPKRGKPTTDDLLLIAYELGNSWKIFGQKLGLNESDLVQIVEDEQKLIERDFGK